MQSIILFSMSFVLIQNKRHKWLTCLLAYLQNTFFRNGQLLCFVCETHNNGNRYCHQLVYGAVYGSLIQRKMNNVTFSDLRVFCPASLSSPLTKYRNHIYRVTFFHYAVDYSLSWSHPISISLCDPSLHLSLFDFFSMLIPLLVTHFPSSTLRLACFVYVKPQEVMILTLRCMQKMSHMHTHI